MPRYTDLDNLIDAVEETAWYHINKNGVLVEGANSKDDVPLYKHEDIMRVLSEAPEADVVEVVRCKDCKHCEVIYPFKHIGMEAVERLYCKSDNKSRMATDICSYGERKE